MLYVKMRVTRVPRITSGRFVFFFLFFFCCVDSKGFCLFRVATIGISTETTERDIRVRAMYRINDVTCI